MPSKPYQYACSNFPEPEPHGLLHYVEKSKIIRLFLITYCGDLDLLCCLSGAVYCTSTGRWYSGCGHQAACYL